MLILRNFAKMKSNGHKVAPVSLELRIKLHLLPLWINDNKQKTKRLLKQFSTVTSHAKLCKTGTV